MDIIKHANIFYVRDVHAIGGVETYLYEMVKKYKDYDIAVVTKNIAPEQKARLKELCKVYVHKHQQIECKVIITNWDTSIYDYVKADKKYTVLHTDYSDPTEKLGLPEDRKDITYIGITDASKKAFEKITGITRTILCRNPYTLEEDKPLLTLLSATRLSDIKDGGRMSFLANTLTDLGINFIWYVITTDEYESNPLWDNRNVVRIPNRLDVPSFMHNADWYVQLSRCEGDSYSLREALYRGLPIVVCDLPYFKEVGIKNNVNALFYNLDNSNAVDVAKRMLKPLKFTFKPIEDGYDKILAESKSTYVRDKDRRYRVRATNTYKRLGMIDGQLGRTPEPGEEWIVDEDRLENLTGDNPYNRIYAELVGEVNQNT